MRMQSKEESKMKKTYVKAEAKVLDLGPADILTLSGFEGKDDVFPISYEEDGEENVSV